MVFKRHKRSDDLVHSPKRWRRDLWVGWKPNGLGEQKPNHYSDISRIAWENRRNLPWAWRILSKGVCDGCALGVAGFHDWTISGVHLCTTRLELLKVNTARAIPDDALQDVAALTKYNGRELRELGRLAHPMVRHRGDRGFRRVSWDDALDLVATRIRAAGPNRLGLYLTARGITNEVYYAAQKAVRFIGTNNVDNAARVCHAPSTSALKETLGVAATTCNYRDVIDSDLIVLFGADVANAQPVFMKYLYLAKKNGARVAVVNPLREPGLEHYWVPSSVESAVFGTKMTDEFFGVHTGGDVAFLNGAMKVLLAIGGIDKEFVRAHTTGFDSLLDQLEEESFDRLEDASGATRADMTRFAHMYADAKSAVLVWSMGITQHVTGVDNVKAIVNLALARGNIGRAGAGLMPIRGHSGVQGGAEMGCYATAYPGGLAINPSNAAALAAQWGFAVPTSRGLDATEMVEGARRGDIEVLWSSGGNFLEVLPAPDITRTALARTPLRVHQDIVLTHQMLVDPGETVVLLPAATRYEQAGGGTSTTTERRVAFSPELDGPRVGEARSEYAIFLDVARRVDADRAGAIGCESAQAIREEIARVVPAYAGIEKLRETGDAIQVGGERLCAGGVFPTGDGRARFSVVVPNTVDVPPGRYLLSTRRGKQFNSMVWKDVDPLTGAPRDALLLSEADAAAIGVGPGDALLVRSPHGEMRARAHVAPMRNGNVQAFFPEANVLLAPNRRDPISGVPDYNAVVEVVKHAVTPDELLELFDGAAAAVRDAVAAIPRTEVRARTERPGQYALDVAADAAACAVLERAPVRIVSEESGVHERVGAGITVVIDPVDGSTNCSRGIAYWATSIAAIDDEGLLCSLVVNQAAGSATTAVRDGGAFRDGVRLRASTVTRVEDSVISIARPPVPALPWKQYRAFACGALALCEVAAGGIDAHIDSDFAMRPWDYLGALLACREAGATVCDAHDEELVTTEPGAHRRIVAAGTSELAEILKRAVA